MLTAAPAMHPGRAHIMDVLCRGFLSSPEAGSGGFFISESAVTRESTNPNAGEAFDSFSQSLAYSLSVLATGLRYVSISLERREWVRL